MARRYKCPYCDDKYERKDLIEHIDNKHEDLIPENFTSTRIVFNLINKRECGFCRVCNKETKWREDLGRYDILCENPKCKEELRRRYQENMIRVRGTDNILNDPEQQKKMLANRSISGKYKFTDGGVLTFTGSYEKKCLEFMDKVLEIPSKDILSPGPTLEYEMNGEKHFYITDFYLIPQNLIIEVKDGGDNLNTKDTPGMRSSRERTLAKEKLITESGEYNYVRLTNNDFAQLIDVLMEIKKAQFDKIDGKIIKVNESTEVINESSTLMNILVGGILLYGATQEFIKIKDKLKDKVKDKNKQEIKYIKKEEASKSFEVLSDDDHKTLQKEIEEANSILKSVYNSKVKSEYKKYLEFKNGNSDSGYELKISRNKSECKYVYCGAAIFMDMSSSKNNDNIDELYNDILKMAESIVKETNEKINNKKLKFNIKTDFEYSGWGGIIMITSSTKLKPKNKLNESYINELLFSESNSIRYYRVTYDGNGIYEEFKNACDFDEWKKFKNSRACNWLPLPPEYKGDYRSYFTKEGFEKFKKYTLPEIKKKLDSDKINIEKLYGDDLDIVYQDKYQVVSEACKDLKTARKFVTDVSKLAKKYNANYFIVTDGASGTSNNGNPAVKHARDCQIEWEKEHGFDPDEDWSSNINESYITEADEDILEKIKKFNKELCTYEYIIVKPNGKVVTKIKQDDFKNYNILSPSKFKRYRGGICWDYVVYENANFPNAKHKTFFFCMVDKDGNPKHTHTFLLFYLNDKTYWFESSWKSNMGIFEFNNEDEALSFIINKLSSAQSDKGDYYVVDYKPNKYIGMSENEFLESMSKLPEYNYKTVKNPSHNVIQSVKVKNGKIVESVVNESYITETSFKSTIDKDFKSKGKKSLKDFKRIKITDQVIKEYKPTIKLLKYIDSKCNAYLYFDGDNPVGVVSVEPEARKDDGTKWITAIEVLKDYQGYGLGKQLLDVAVKELGGNSLSVAKDNQVAKQMYEKYGFRASKESEELVKSGNKYVYFMYLPGVYPESYITESRNNKCLIVSCFAGVGKNYAINQLSNMGFKVYSIEKERDFYTNICKTGYDYTNYINKLSKSVDILFIPYFLNMENRFINGRVDYYLVYPSINCKNDYVKRFKELGFTKEQIKYLSDNWNDMITDCITCDIKNNKKIELNRNEYVLDVILNLLGVVNESVVTESSNITLYHGTDIPDFDVILPNSYNVGERFGKPRMSSYWFNNPEYAMTFATMTILDNNLPKDTNGRACLDNDMIIILPKRYKNEALKLLKNNNGYVYYREVNKSIISRGHARYFPEYTVDIPLKPDGIIIIGYNEMVKRVRFVEQDYFDNIMHKYANDQMRYDASIFQQIFDIVTKHSTGEIPKRSRVLKKYAKQSKLDECYINEASNNNCVIVSCFAGMGKNYDSNIEESSFVTKEDLDYFNKYIK